MSDIRITGFEIIEKIGEGGMASVWKARQLSLDRIVAIKILSAGLASDPSDVRRFQTEAQAAARLKHPGIVQVYDANAENGLYFFVMEFVDGYTVGDWVRRKGALSEKDALLVIDCVADALEYAWDNQGIIHCDVKPDNVMVDADGSVKVADLGLARTISAVSAQKQADEIMGTPAYISPEQARGLPDLDCRADIYSLGAMLYHLLTGRLLFEGNPDEQVVDMQVEAQVDDPLDANPKLSKAACWLMEKMLAKDRENREKDWKAVRRDIARTRRGLPPIHRLPADAASTITRSRHRSHADTHRYATHHVPSAQVDARGFRWGTFLVAALIVGVLFVALLSLGRKGKPPQQARPKRPATPVATRPAGTVPRHYAEQDAHDMYNFAMKWVAEHPGQYDLAIARFQKVVRQTRGTKYSLMAEDEIRKLSEAREVAVSRVLQTLQRQVDPLVEADKLLEAAAVLDGYTGEWQKETERLRTAQAEALRTRYKQALAREKADDERRRLKYATAWQDLARALIHAGVAGAVPLVDQSVADPDLAEWKAEFVDVQETLEKVQGIDGEILASFLAQKGQEVTIQTVNGSETFVLADVRDGQIIGTEHINMAGARATRDHVVALSDLSSRERLQRMGDDNAPHIRMAKGLMAYELGAFEHAEKYLGDLGDPLSKLLLAHVDKAASDSANADAEAALVRLLQTLGLAIPAYDEAACIRAIRDRYFSADDVERNRQLVEQYREARGETEFAKNAEPVLRALAPTPAAMPATPGLDADETPPPADQAAAGLRAAIEMALRNPGLRKEDISIEKREDGSVRAVQIESPLLRDIQALRVVETLEDLACGGGPAHGEITPAMICPLSDLSPLSELPLKRLFAGVSSVSDLTPLTGMKLTELNVRWSQVSDLTPLRGMPLSSLNVGNTKIRNLTPIKGMSLRFLHLSNTKVTEFSSLSGMPLQSLDLSQTQVRDLSVLRGMPLANLNLAGTRVNSFLFLRSLPLEELVLAKTQVRDLSWMSGLRLTTLDLNDTPVSDISALRGMPLTRLALAGTGVKSLEPLRGMALQQLSLDGTNVRDIAPLAGMPLVNLSMRDTGVEDISVLQGMALQYLDMGNLPVADLSALRGMPLRYLDVLGVTVDALEPLVGLPVEHIWMDLRDPQARRVLGTMPRLQTINGQDVGQPIQVPMKRKDIRRRLRDLGN